MYQYEFWKLNDTQRNEYVSRLEMRLYYERHVPENIKLLFWNKERWLKYFKDYVNRSWISLSNISYNEFRNLIVPNKDYIAKPLEGSLGIGIFKFTRNEVSQSLFNKLKKENYLVEELIHNESSLAAFHLFSLNTIRITTLPDGNIIGTFIRFGNNKNLVDNAHTGGIFAKINPDTGIIETDGIDTEGHHYIIHPYSNIKFKGFEIPRWEEIKRVVREMHSKVPDAPVIGWDVCIDSKNRIEIIEGNHLPDVDVLQSPTKTGIRKKLEIQLKKAGLPSLNE